MMHAAALAGFSAVLGGAIALVARQRPGVVERTRPFAFGGAAGVVAFHLLPEALPAQGVAALPWMAAGFALPWLLEWLARTVGPGLLQGRGLSGLRVSAEVGFAALVFHSVAEGLALVAALAQPRASLDLEIAIVAHHAPLTAAVVLPFLDLSGARAAGTRAARVADPVLPLGRIRAGAGAVRPGGRDGLGGAHHRAFPPLGAVAPRRYAGPADRSGDGGGHPRTRPGAAHPGDRRCSAGSERWRIPGVVRSGGGAPAGRCAQRAPRRSGGRGGRRRAGPQGARSRDRDRSAGLRAAHPRRHGAGPRRAGARSGSGGGRPRTPPPHPGRRS